MSTHTDGYRAPSEVTMAELFPNHDGLRPLAVADLIGRQIDVTFEEGSQVSLKFLADAVTVEVSEYGSWLFLAGTLPCEVIPVRADCLAATLHDGRNQASYLIFFDFSQSRTFVTRTQMLAGPSGVGESTRFSRAASTVRRIRRSKTALTWSASVSTGATAKAINSNTSISSPTATAGMASLARKRVWAG
jgi:hypothetical protein